MKKSKYNVAVVGVGAVGIEMLRCLRQRNFPIGELRVFARSARDIEVDGQKYSVKAISPEGFDGIDIALFAGTEGEKGAAVTYASEAVKRGAVVIDNGADFRMDPGVPLVVPEVNAKDVNPIRNWFLLKKHRPEGRGLASNRPQGHGLASYGQSHSQSHKGIIANPNCSTIQLVVALWPIYKKAGIKRLVVTTLQASSGAGRLAVEQLKEEISQIASSEFKDVQAQVQNKTLPQQLGFNVYPQIGSFAECDYTTEEWKLVKETHKIMHDKKIKVSATCVRVPVRTGHSESVYIETVKPIEPDKARDILSQAPGVIVIDDPQKSLYPMPKDIEGKDEVFVGRVRSDPFIKNGLWLWIVSDNLRKGAALNAIQIAELLIK
jgi:aspartate-semialdehyde dehydrogenase